jgi:hypothetical protein
MPLFRSRKSALFRSARRHPILLPDVRTSAAQGPQRWPTPDVNSAIAPGFRPEAPTATPRPANLVMTGCLGLDPGDAAVTAGRAIKTLTGPR